MKKLKSYGYRSKNLNGNLEVFYKEEAGVIFNRNPKEKRVEFTNRGWKSVSGGKFCLDTIQRIVEVYFAEEGVTNCNSWIALNSVMISFNYNTIVEDI